MANALSDTPVLAAASVFTTFMLLLPTSAAHSIMVSIMMRRVSRFMDWLTLNMKTTTEMTIERIEMIERRERTDAMMNVTLAVEVVQGIAVTPESAETPEILATDVMKETLEILATDVTRGILEILVTAVMKGTPEILATDVTRETPEILATAVTKETLEIPEILATTVMKEIPETPETAVILEILVIPEILVILVTLVTSATPVIAATAVMKEIQEILVTAAILRTPEIQEIPATSVTSVTPATAATREKETTEDHTNPPTRCPPLKSKPDLTSSLNLNLPTVTNPRTVNKIKTRSSRIRKLLTMRSVLLISHLRLKN